VRRAYVWLVRGFPTGRTAALAVGFALTFSSARAVACGASAGGVAGVSGCSLAEHNEAVRKKWHVGVSGAYSSTSIRFSPELRLDQTRTAALGVLSYSPRPNVTLEYGAGALADGTFERAGVEFDFSPGLLLLLGGSYRLVANEGVRPFVLLGGQLAYVTARTTELGAAGAESAGYNAFDLRFGPVVGWTIWNTLTPYVLARLFGGPVFWSYQGEAVAGGDVHHYQLGAGLSLLVAKRVTAFVEGVPLGERTLAGGVGFAF
jgi:hypothetical protein